VVGKWQGVPESSERIWIKMYLSIPSGPAGHIGISLILAYLLRLNPVVTIFCGILPDLVDKPLSAMGVGGGRYIGHTLLFAFLFSIAFYLWKRRYGLAALVGGISHLLLDLNALVPWLYPFKEYDLYEKYFSFSEFVGEYLTFSGLGTELILVVIAGVIAFLCLWLFRRRENDTGRRKLT
jgi:hypothetical protein